MSLTVSNLSKKYGNKTVLDHLSFEMPEPGVYALLGTNGAGKTTTIRMMLGMLAKDSGEVLWNGKPLDTATCNVGYLAEERGLYPKYTLMDQLMYFAGLRGVSKSDAKKRIRYWAERLQVGAGTAVPQKPPGCRAERPLRGVQRGASPSHRQEGAAGRSACISWGAGAISPCKNPSAIGQNDRTAPPPAAEQSAPRSSR